MEKGGKLSWELSDARKIMADRADEQKVIEYKTIAYIDIIEDKLKKLRKFVQNPAPYLKEVKENERKKEAEKEAAIGEMERMMEEADKAEEKEEGQL